MSVTTQPPQPSPSVEPDQVHSSLPPSIQPQFITPLPYGSCAEEDEDYDVWDPHVRGDLQSRVFVDFEVFMKSVLHAPDDWRTRWGPAIEAVKAYQEFAKHHEEYCERCENEAPLEGSFYKPLMNTTNAVIDALSRSTFNGFSLGISQYTRVNEPNLSPDLVTLHKDCPSKTKRPRWAKPVWYTLEVEPFDNSACDGRYMPRLVVDGIDPISTHAPVPIPLRYRAKKHNSPARSTTVSESTSMSRKRPTDRSSEADERPKKRFKTSSVSLESCASVQSDGEDESHSTPEPEAQRWSSPAVQACHYLLRKFFNSVLRSHVTASLVDRGRLQLYHVNRTVILVSSAIDFSEGDGVDKFIAYVIASHCHPFKDVTLDNNTQPVRNSNIPEDNKVVQGGMRLHFAGKKLPEPFTVDLGDVIARDPATIGRSTVVFGATSDRWKDTKLVVKISWPDSDRISETDFLKKANEAAEKTDGKWATKHLPRVLYDEDVAFDPDLTLESVARLFENAKVVNGAFKYERRTLRVIVQERLYSLKSLANVKDIGQVFLDVICIHRWLYDVPGILHCDLSFNNIMCRIIEEMNAKGETEGKVYGVLTDYDLSSWTASLKAGDTKTSQQQIGTPPYMAQELLKGTSTIHLYRHDIESLFYVMLTMCGRRTIDDAKGGMAMRDGALPYQMWFNLERSYTLGCIKGCFFWDAEAIELSPPFDDFRVWLEDLQWSFQKGFRSKSLANLEAPSHWLRRRLGGLPDEVGPTPVPFDDETLGGYVNYSAVIEPTRYLEGELKGLIIRYDPPGTTTPVSLTSADTAQVDDQVDSNGH